MRLQSLLRSLAQVRSDWRRGRRYGYPRCCIAMFCWDALWSVPPSLTRVVSQGVEPAREGQRILGRERAVERPSEVDGGGAGGAQ